MDDCSNINQNQEDNLDRITQLEKELEVLKVQATEAYQGRRTESPVRVKLIKSLSSVENDRNLTTSIAYRLPQINTNPTYIEESTISNATSKKAPPQGKPGALKIVGKIGIALLILSLLAVFIYLLFNII